MHTVNYNFDLFAANPPFLFYLYAFCITLLSTPPVGDNLKSSRQPPAMAMPSNCAVTVQPQ